MVRRICLRMRCACHVDIHTVGGGVGGEREDMKDAVPTIPGPRPGRAAPTHGSVQSPRILFFMAAAQGLTVTRPVDVEGTSSYFSTLVLLGGVCSDPSPEGSRSHTTLHHGLTMLGGVFRVLLATSARGEGIHFLAGGLPIRPKLSMKT